MKTRLRYNPKEGRLNVRQDVVAIFGREDKDLAGLANALTLTIYDPQTPIGHVIESLQIVIRDLKLRRSIEHATVQEVPLGSQSFLKRVGEARKTEGGAPP